MVVEDFASEVYVARSKVQTLKTPKGDLLERGKFFIFIAKHQINIIMFLQISRFIVTADFEDIFLRAILLGPKYKFSVQIFLRNFYNYKIHSNYAPLLKINSFENLCSEPSNIDRKKSFFKIGCNSKSEKYMHRKITLYKIFGKFLRILDSSSDPLEILSESEHEESGNAEFYFPLSI